MLGFDLSTEPWIDDFLAAAADAGEDVSAGLDLARRFGTRLAPPATGRTRERWAVFAALARANVTAARIVEAHCDAAAILAEAGHEVGDRTYGVFAAEAPGARLDAEVGADGSAVLSGTKAWCSLGADVDAALVTAHVGDQRQLFEVDLRQETVHAHGAEGWVARGLRTVVSVPIDFDHADARAVGGPGWYLHRAGFAWGGIGVAACWHGAALGLLDAIGRAAASRDGELSAMHLGAADTALHASRCVLVDAADAVDSGAVRDPAVLALRCRSVVADAAERVLQHAGHALGPAPMAFDQAHSARVADLELYVRQHHGERDLAELGRQLRTRR